MILRFLGWANFWLGMVNGIVFEEYSKGTFFIIFGLCVLISCGWWPDFRSEEDR